MPTSPPEPVLDPGHAVESAVTAFESACWKSGGARVADFCPDPASPHYLAIAAELIRVDLEFAWRRGDHHRVEQYRDDFAALFRDPASLAAVAFEEYRLRLNHGESATPAEYAERYGIDVRSWSPEPDSIARTEVVAEIPRERGDAFPEEGDLLGGFRIESEIGRGSFARVYLAYQSELADRPVVIKVSRHFVEESQTLARLQHTNIVPIHSVHSIGALQAVCMPYFGRTTLGHVLRSLHAQPTLPSSAQEFVGTIQQQIDETTRSRSEWAALSGRMPKPDAAPPLSRLSGLSHIEAVLWIGSQLADALAHAHDRGILHRDIKPANVLLADDGRPMLLDFNLAAELKGRSPIGQGGTPLYMSPEQLAAWRWPAASIDGRSDLYSLGLVLYELLGGRLHDPQAESSRDNRMDRLRASRLQPLPPLTATTAQVTPAVQAILAKCTHPEPAQRYQSAGQLREDLERQLDHRPLRYAAEPWGLERLRKWRRRNPWVGSAAFLAGALAVVGTTAGLTVHHVIRQRDADRIALAESRFDQDYQRHRIALATGLPGQRERILADVRATVNRFGLPGRDGATAAEYTLGPNVPARVGDLYLSVAAYELSRDDAGAVARATDWLEHARALSSTPTQQQVIDGLTRAAGDPAPTGDPIDRLYRAIARRDHATVIMLLEDRSPSRMQPAHWVTLGSARRAMGEYRGAVAAYSTALSLLGRDQEEVLAARGATHFDAGDYANALADLSRALVSRPDDAATRIDRALTLMKLGRCPEAIADLDEASRLWPRHGRILFIRADAHEQLGDLAAARRDREAGLAMEPGDEESWIARGMARLRAGDAAGALSDFESARADRPRSRDARLNIAAVLADHQGRPADAITVLDELLRDEPELVAARAGRAVYRARLGDRAAAHDDAAHVLRRNPAAFFRYQLAGVFALTSKTHPADADRALALLASALQDRVGLEYVDVDGDLKPLATDPRFRELIAAARTVKVREKLPTP